MLTDEFINKSIENAIISALEEDHSFSGDITTLAIINENSKTEAIFFVNTNCVIAGVNIVTHVFDIFARCNNYKKVSIEWYVRDGEYVTEKTIIGKVYGNTRILLACERVALNIIQRMSGIATKTRECVNLVSSHNTKILDTRKTAPNLRVLDKLAVKIGGGVNHRLGLYDQFFIKENHIKACGGDVCSAIKKVNNFMITGYAEKIPLIVEVSNINQIMQIFDENLDVCISRLLLDDMISVNDVGEIDLTKLNQVITFIDKRIKTEVSNVNEKMLSIVASTGVNYISCGYLTNSIIAPNISMNIKN